MSRLTPAIIAELSRALSSAYLSVTQVDEFLRTKLDRRYNNLASRLIPLDDAIYQIVLKAHEQGWVADLVRKAAEDRPRNATLRRLCDAVPNLDPAKMPVLGRSVIDRPSLLCGRASQWNDVCLSAPTRIHQVMLVPGGRGQEPMHFRDRVRVWLTPDPARAMVAVDWPTPPKSLDEMLEALALAMQTGVAALAQTLRERLAYQNLVLLHPCIFEGFSQPHFVDYYTGWIPAALSQRTAGVLKCIQPVEWSIAERQGGFLSRLLSRERRVSDARGGALALITTLREKQVQPLRILDVDELLNLQRRELEQFLEGSEFSVEHQKVLLSQLLGGPQIPGYMFKTIDDYWKNVGGAQ
jgi:hypothetical protein